MSVEPAGLALASLVLVFAWMRSCGSCFFVSFFGLQPDSLGRFVGRYDIEQRQQRLEGFVESEPQRLSNAT